MRRESDFDRKGCLLVTWLIAIVIAGEVIGYLMKGEWIAAIGVPLSLSLLVLIPCGIIKLLTWSSDKFSKEDNNKYSNKKDN